MAAFTCAVHLLLTNTRSLLRTARSPVWSWLFFAGECIVAVGVWTSHFQRSFPAIRYANVVALAVLS